MPRIARFTMCASRDRLRLSLLTQDAGSAGVRAGPRASGMRRWRAGPYAHPTQTGRGEPHYRATDPIVEGFYDTGWRQGRFRVAMRWPAATLDPSRRHTRRLAIGSVALSGLLTTLLTDT